MPPKRQSLVEYLGGTPTPQSAIPAPLDYQQATNEQAANAEMNPLEKILSIVSDTPNKQFRQRNGIPE